MRLAHAAALALALLAPHAARADQPASITVLVGESKPLGGAGARCDDLDVVSVTLGPQAVVTGLKAGKTLCSVAVGGPGGARRVLEVTVLAAEPEPAPVGEPTPAPKPGEKPKPVKGDRRPDGG